MARLLATHGLVRLIIIRQQEQIYRANDGTYKTILTKTMHTYFSRHNKNRRLNRWLNNLSLGTQFLATPKSLSKLPRKVIC